MLTKHVYFRMAVEFYMTNGRFLAIGLLACSNCKIKSLKGLDFSNSYILPESGHPLNPLLPPLSSPVLEAEHPIKREPDERVDMLHGKRLLPRENPVHREVILPPNNANQGKVFYKLWWIFQHIFESGYWSIYWKMFKTTAELNILNLDL